MAWGSDPEGAIELLRQAERGARVADELQVGEPAEDSHRRLALERGDGDDQPATS